MSEQLVMATGNAGKVREMAAILAEHGMDVAAQTDFDVPEADETGSTFVENAIIKARNAAGHTGRPALADDSGLVVDALSGAPGIYSARFAGPGATDAANIDRLLRELSGVDGDRRWAHFHCTMVFLRHAEDPEPLISQAVWRGRILEAPRGERGFGYDPVFFVPEHDCTAAELPAETKNRISHRGRALHELVQRLTAAPAGRSVAAGRSRDG